jgi:hypothetical protein
MRRGEATRRAMPMFRDQGARHRPWTACERGEVGSVRGRSPLPLADHDDDPDEAPDSRSPPQRKRGAAGTERRTRFVTTGRLIDQRSATGRSAP